MKKLNIPMQPLLIFLFFLVGTSKATEIEYLKYIPKDSYIFQEYTSDLNQDGVLDKILIVASKDEDGAKEGSDAYYRKLLILLGGKDGFKKVVETSKLIYCKTCGGMMGDPFTDITIKPPYFTIEHYGGSAWRWQSYITFKYSIADKKFYLYKTGDVSFHAPDAEKTKVKIKTVKNFGKVEIHKFDIYKKQ
jgi:hypothetical protein